jgi:polyhydroxyalkanoate synthase
MTDRTAASPDLATAEAALSGALPFANVSRDQLGHAFGRWATALGRNPVIMASETLSWAGEELRVLAGTSRLSPDPKDRRFSDPVWQNAFWHRVAQSYLATGAMVLRSVDELRLEGRTAKRARFALSQFIDAAAPTNALATNPVAIKRAWRTRGRSLIDGAHHFAHDVLHNGGLPSQVDTRPFRVSETVGVTPGAVVHRSEVFELLQYQPVTATVGTIPTLVIPPQINRFYFLDLAPGRSFVEYCVQRGMPMFMMSWRNPRPENRDWGLDTYADACLEAMTVLTDILGVDQTNAIGFCSGGMTEAALLSHLAQTGNSIVNAAGMAVSLVDTDVWSNLHAFIDEETLASSLLSSRRKGILEGRSLARVFAWMRPNDLVWNYWVSNYLLGETPPAFDVLAWNADSTNLSAALHADLMEIWRTNALMKPGEIQVLGSPVDLSTVKNDVYVVGAITDHLVPWQSAWAATHALGGSVRFVLSHSGHIQALINAPGSAKASFFENDDHHSDPAAWLEAATNKRGSWWVDWADWALERSGPARPRPKALGNRRHPPLEPAPGRYVHER